MIRRLRLENWLCYRGVHEITLGAKVYAIAARDASNPERSNWLGKTSLMEAIRFALYGSHRHRTEDAWITKDEPAGLVEIELDGGLVIRRSRKRGKRTEVTVEGAMQKEADLAIARVMGMSEEDFLATSYFEQRQMARFILERPAARMETVRAWTRLDKLEEASASVLTSIRALQSAVDAKQAERAVYVRQIEEATGGTFDEEQNAAALIAVRLELAGVVEEYQAAREAQAKYAKRGDLAAIVQRGKDLAAQLKGADHAEEISALEQQKGVVFARFTEVERENTRLSSARPFDGRCPVLRDACPVAKDVTTRCASDVELRKKVGVEYAEASAQKRDVADKLSRLSIQQQNREQNARTLEGLRAKRDVLLAEGVSLTMQAPTGVDVISARKHEIDRRERDLLDARLTHAREVGNIGKAEKAVREIDAVIEKQRAEIEVLQAVAQVFGRNGAQKIAAKGILSEIESGANDAIAECGIDLSVELTWGEQGEGLAKECGKCGAAFPTSARVKACERCGAERGANMMQRLDVRLSERSGAAEDIAGMAVQLAASGWLRRTRGATWDTALIDEPFAQLDAYHRKSLAKHFSAMLSGRYGFRQAIVIAHHPEVTFAFPGRIEIEWANDCASLRVIE